MESVDEVTLYNQRLGMNKDGKFYELNKLHFNGVRVRTGDVYFWTTQNGKCILNEKLYRIEEAISRIDVSNDYVLFLTYAVFNDESGERQLLKEVKVKLHSLVLKDGMAKVQVDNVFNIVTEHVVLGMVRPGHDEIYETIWYEVPFKPGLIKNIGVKNENI